MQGVLRITIITIARADARSAEDDRYASTNASGASAWTVDRHQEKSRCYDHNIFTDDIFTYKDKQLSLINTEFVRIVG